MTIRTLKGVIAAFVFAAAFFGVVSGQTKPTAFRAITIVTEPSASVWIDGVGWGKADKTGRMEIKTISSGAHSLRVRANGYKEKTLPLTAVQKGEISVPLIKSTDEAELAFQDGERMAFSDREKAAEAYQKAVKLRPNYHEAYVALARVLTEIGDSDGALAAISTARKLRPGYAEASAVEGRIHKENGDEAKAVAVFKRAITEGKGFQPEAYAGLGLYYKEKAEGAGASGDFANEDLNYAEASKNLKVSLKQLSGAPDTVVIYQLLGLIYERQKKYDEAIATYEEFLRIFPNSNEATAVRSFIVQIRKTMADTP
ncbi:MAG: tetratricopeptide repeat protein [Pyrinomonadaceae bacterium]